MRADATNSPAILGHDSGAGMPQVRAVALVLLALVFHGIGCGGSAVGVDDCRTIEKARCAAARYCPLGIDSNADADACDRFARDNCLHGLPIGASPPASKLDACVRAIDAAQSCARNHGADALATGCGLAGGVTTTSATACEIIQDPEEAVDCGFLLATPKAAVTPPTDAGGAD